MENTMISGCTKRLGRRAGAGGSLVLLVRLHEGTLIAGLSLGDPVEGADAAKRVVSRSVAEEFCFGVLPVTELPLGAGHVLDQAGLVGGFGVVGAQEQVADLPELIEVFAWQTDAGGRCAGGGGGVGGEGALGGGGGGAV